MLATMYLPADQNCWPFEFAAAGLDVTPHPMVMRIADLFIGGKDFARKAKLDPDKVWQAIERNVDGLIAFFHLLMTRDRIPLIDYEYTFDATNFNELNEIAVALHPPIYQDLKERAKEKLSTLDLSRIPVERRKELATERGDELAAVGYEWFPQPGQQFAGDDRLLATLLLGGLIFGGYAQISGAGSRNSDPNRSGNSAHPGVAAPAGTIVAESLRDEGQDAGHAQAAPDSGPAQSRAHSGGSSHPRGRVAKKRKSRGG